MSYRSKPGYVDDLLILRGLCAFGVLIAHGLHSLPDFYVWETVIYSPEWLSTSQGQVIARFWPTTGAAFVYVFFAHSGYLMGKVYWNRQYVLNRKSLSHFYWNRFLRIAPLLYFNLFIVLCLAGKLNEVFARPLATLGDFLFFNNITGRYINDVTWSISYEMQDYLICPLFFLFLSRKNGKVLFGSLSAVALLSAYSKYSQAHEANVVLGLARFTWCFLGGYCVNLIVRYVHEDFRIGGGAISRILGFAAFGGGILGYYSLYNTENVFAAQVELLIATMVALLLLELPRSGDESAAVQPAGWGTWFGRGLTWLGMISYGVYLWHYPILSSILRNPDVMQRIVGWSRRVSAAASLPLLIVPNVVLTIVLAIPVLLLSLATFLWVEVRYRPSLYAVDARVPATAVEATPVADPTAQGVPVMKELLREKMDL